MAETRKRRSRDPAATREAILEAARTLLAKDIQDQVRAVYAHGGLVSFQTVTASPFIYLPHDCIVPGALSAGDLSDIAAALAPRPASGLRREVVSCQPDGAARRLAPLGPKPRLFDNCAARSKGPTFP